MAATTSTPTTSRPAWPIRCTCRQSSRSGRSTSRIHGTKTHPSSISFVADALVIFKPDASYRLAVRAAMWKWLSSEQEWGIKALTWYQPTSALIESHYDFLQGRPFFPWLVEFMTALPLVVGRITATPEALERMRYDL